LKIKKYLVALIAFSLLFSIATVAIAQDEYSDVITDEEGDVMRLVDPDDETWIYVENPTIDITTVELSETDDWVMVELTVKGTITDNSSIIYEVYLLDDQDGTYHIKYSDGECTMVVNELYNFNPPANGVGTETLSIVFTREQIYEPNDLWISVVKTYYEENAEVDIAGPDADYPDVEDPDDFVEYQDLIIDEEGDVSYWTTLDPYAKQVDEPDADISRVELSTVEDTISVSLTVLGEIIDNQEYDEYILYQVWLLDEDSKLYWIQSDGYETNFAAGSDVHETQTTGIGTNTLTVSFSAEDIGKPEMLELRDAEVMKTVEDDDGVGHYYRDTATAEDDENGDDGNGDVDNGDDDVDNGDDANGDVDNGDDDGEENGKEENGDEEKGFLSDYWWIIPIIIIGGVVGLVLVMKMGNKGEPMQPGLGVQNQQQTYEVPQQDTPPPPPPEKE